ncbi:Chemoreceptor glutamine deamidase CheD [Paraconexibacter sp. AEG42_29]|uniref:Probable chemoreceptor glutamine deamidase CheD n=1 Tax=Paraconexibacter sp. AEG42_29 TaxID=2997339 RepID=A0AAU7ANM6_9ACTN
MSSELPARMGEWVIGTEAGTVLTCIGLGSCIGLALIDRRTKIAGLAHVMLPEAPSGPGAAKPSQPDKFADHAVPAMIEALIHAGAMRHRLEAVLVGGAQMFALGRGSGQDIGARNEAAVRAQLDRARIPVRAAATGGGKGRSMRVVIPAGEVVYKEAAGRPITLLDPSADTLRMAA